MSRTLRPLAAPAMVAVTSAGCSNAPAGTELHIHRTLLTLQVDLNAKAPTCAAFAEPSSGLEPETPSL
jgi:hypothetical protein